MTKMDVHGATRTYFSNSDTLHPSLVAAQIPFKEKNFVTKKRHDDSSDSSSSSTSEEDQTKTDDK